MEGNHYDRSSGTYCFQKIPALEVNIELRERAEDMLTFVCAELNILNPKLTWLRPALATECTQVFGDSHQIYREEIHERFARIKDDDPDGYTPRHLQNEIWIRDDDSTPTKIEWCVAHETRHVWQKIKDVNIFANYCRAEGDAYPYSYEALERYLAQKGILSEFEDGIKKKKEAARSFFLRCCPHGQFKTL
jgi:hypothetical protein